MQAFIRKFLIRKLHERSFRDQEVDEFLLYLRREKFGQVLTEELESRIKLLSKMIFSEKLKKLPGLYLFVEKSFISKQNNPEKEKINLRREVKSRFPGLCEHRYFKIIFLSNHDQEEMLAQFLIDHIWEKTVEVVGDSKNEHLKNYEYQVNKAFEQFKHNQLSRIELQSTLKYEILNLFNIIAEIIGKDKISQWFQKSYNFLTDNYKFLDSFSFLVALLPESLLNEQQLSILSRAQIESVLIEKTEKLEKFNERLKDEVTEREKAQRALEQNADRLNKIIENAMDAVVLMDQSGCISFWNNQAEEIFGWSSEEVLGKRVSDFIIPSDKKHLHENGLKNYVTHHREKYLNRRIEETGITKDGKLIDLELSIVANQIDDSVIFTSFIRDISERKRYEKMLMDARDKAEKASQTKANFLSTMSHEIRTPMNGLFGTIELLLSENPREDQVDSLNLMKHSTESLLVILNDILDLSKIEEGHVEFDSRAFSLSELCGRVISTYFQQAEEKGIKLFIKSDSNFPDTLEGDPVRFSQILNNLISNAIKFTYEGEVELKVQLLEEYEKEALFRFDIIDTGSGIPDQELSRIFERFTQVESQKRKQKQSGTGLGLAICRKLLQLQGSDLKVTSELGKGSNFFFEIKLKKSSVKKAKTKKSTDLNRDLTGLKILLIEDNKVNQIVAKKFLDKWHCDITIANNGLECVELIKTQEYDILLMDLQMPLMDGYEATIAIRKMEGSYFQDVPIIALTADVLAEVKDRVKEVGMNDFMTKPFDSEKLFYTITSNLKFFKMSK